jgi:Kef-type K+ transport system membrane component KefB
LSELIVFLVATVVVVPLARSLHVSPILGYLAVGIAAGPSGFELIHNVDEVRAFAELGVVFLLFAVGIMGSSSNATAMTPTTSSPRSIDLRGLGRSSIAGRTRGGGS